MVQLLEKLEMGYTLDSGDKLVRRVFFKPLSIKI